MAHAYSELTPDTIFDAIEAQGYRCDGQYLALNSYENRVFQFGIEDGQPIIAKFYRPNRWSKEQILEEHDFCLELAAAEWPVVPPLKAQNGCTLHDHGKFKFALFERKGGRTPELDDLDNLEALGRQLGRLHAVGSLKPFNKRPQIDIESYGIKSREFLLSNDFIPDSLVAAYETLSKDLIDTVTRKFHDNPYEILRLHGDCHAGNILWRDEAPLFVDFDDCRSGPAIQDLWLLLSGDRGQQRLQLETILEGYELFHDFDNRELQLVESLRTLRMMHYAAWLARRWSDPAFPMAFPWFNTERYWGEHIISLREQLSELQEPPLQRITAF
tara:strand:+ start:5439 stop:6425 length:987 start_codon:yes stop_codon:yes gene_type:complete